MRVLITGSEGNIGRRLVPYLKLKGYKVHRFDIKQGYEDDYTVGNICSPYELGRAFYEFKPDVVYHMAAMVSRVTCEASPALTAETNLGGLENVIQLCVLHEAKLIYFSTSEVYGNVGGELREITFPDPNNFYGLTKYLGESLVEYSVKHQKLAAITVRPFMFYDEFEDMGVHRSAMIRFAEALCKGEKVQVHEGAKRSWLHMNDAIRFLEKVMFQEGYNIFNLGHPSVIPVSLIAEYICAMLGKDKKDYIEYTPLPSRMTLTKHPNLDKQTNILKVTPEISINEGIRRVVDEVQRKLAIDKPVGGGNLPYSRHWVSPSGS